MATAGATCALRFIRRASSGWLAWM
jgi:hypothetical protein